MNLQDIARRCRDEAALTCCAQLGATLLEAAQALESSTYRGPCLACAERPSWSGGLCMRCYTRHRRATGKKTTNP